MPPVVRLRRLLAANDRGGTIGFMVDITLLRDILAVLERDAS